MTQTSQDWDLPRLVQAAKRDEAGALDRLLGQYRNYLRLLGRTWLNRDLRGKADPSDLVQETLLRAGKAFGEFRGTSEVELVAWLRRIMARQLADLMRRLRAGRRDVGPRTAARGSRCTTGSTTWPRRAFPAPAEQLQRRELGVMLADALAQLSPPRREVIVLRNSEELDWPEVARRMGKSEAAGTQTVGPGLVGIATFDRRLAMKSTTSPSVDIATRCWPG